MKRIAAFIRSIWRVKLVLALITLAAVAGVTIWIRGKHPKVLEKEPCVYEIANTDNLDRYGDVVFIHGLDGDYQSTWESNGDPKFFFPKELGVEFKDIGFWSVDYPSSSSDWFGRSMAIEDRSKGLLELLRYKLVTAPSSACDDPRIQSAVKRILKAACTLPLRDAIPWRDGRCYAHRHSTIKEWRMRWTL